jgi:hypothetical protein
MKKRDAQKVTRPHVINCLSDRSPSPVNVHPIAIPRGSEYQAGSYKLELPQQKENAKITKVETMCAANPFQ